MRFAPFAVALAAMASAVFVMAAPAPETLDVRVPEARDTPSVNDVLTELKNAVAEPIATLNALNTNTYSSAVVTEESGKIYTAVNDAATQLAALQSTQVLDILFGTIGWANSILSVSGISLDTIAALAHALTLIPTPGSGLNARDDPQTSINNAVAQFSALYYNFLGLFNGALSNLLTPGMEAFTDALQGNLEPLLSVFGRSTYIFFQQTSGLVFLLATDPPAN